MNEYFNKLYKTEGLDFTIYSYTDSVAEDTLIDINNVKIKIEDFWNQIPGTDLNVKTVPVIYVVSCSDGINILNKPVHYIMRHEVEKELFELVVEGKKIIITEDHSIVIERNNKLISVKPKEIQPEDLIIYKYIQIPKDETMKCPEK